MNIIVRFLEYRGYKFTITRNKKYENKCGTYLILNEQYNLSDIDKFSYERESVVDTTR